MGSDWLHPCRMEALDQLHLQFSSGSVWVLNGVLAALIFGMALELKPADFVRVFRKPKGVMIGLAAQFLLLPAFTFLLVQVIRPTPSVALGMMMVAACPGGNVSNLIVYMSKGNLALSVGMTAISSTAAIVLMPVNFAFWVSLDSEASLLLSELNMDRTALVLSILIVLALPLALGMMVGRKFPNLGERMRTPLRRICTVIFFAFVAIALVNNRSHLNSALLPVIAIVIAHNASALSLGYGLAWIANLPVADRRAVSIEVGIQNSGLALGIIFSVFGGLGGMALVAMLWGIWHIIAGGLLASIWSRRDASV